MSHIIMVPSEEPSTPDIWRFILKTGEVIYSNDASKDLKKYHKLGLLKRGTRMITKNNLEI